MPRRTDPTDLTQRSLRVDRTNRGTRGADTLTAATIPPLPEEHEVRSNRTAQSGRRHFASSLSQVGDMIASCLPSDKALLFKRTLLSEGNKFREGGGAFSTCPGRTRLGYLSKCPVECIEEALKICFAGRAVLVTRLSSVDEYEPVGTRCGDVSGSSSSWLQFYVMDGVLNRSLRPPRKETPNKVVLCNNNVVELGSSNMKSVPLKISFTGDTTSTEDKCYRAVVAAIPDAGIFYSSHERRSALVPQGKEAKGHNSIVLEEEPFYGNRPYKPMEIAWLRVRCRDCIESDANKNGEVDGECRSWFRRGGYVVQLFGSGLEDDLMPRIWKIAICGPPRRGTNVGDASPLDVCPHSVLQAYHAPDGYGIPLPPDIFLETTKQDGKEETVVVRKNVCDARVYYREKLRLSSSSKKRCRHYVKWCASSSDSLRIVYSSTGSGRSVGHCCFGTGSTSVYFVTGSSRTWLFARCHEV